MRECDGDSYMAEFRAREPRVEPCPPSCTANPRLHVHCGVCGVAVAPYAGPMSLDGRPLGPVCSRLACFWEACRRAAPDMYERAAVVNRERQTWARHVQAARSRDGLDVAALARATGTSPEAITALEAASALPVSDHVFARIRAVLGI